MCPGGDVNGGYSDPNFLVAALEIGHCEMWFFSRVVGGVQCAVMLNALETGDLPKGPRVIESSSHNDSVRARGVLSFSD